MSNPSRIEWTDATWNPVTGCSKISPGCKNCYAERMAMRLQAMGQPRYRNGFKVTLQSDILTLPLTWKRPSRIFVCSMSDLFHPDVPLSFVSSVFNVMGKAHWHVFQILTKRSKRLLELSTKLTWYDNVWIGVSVENSDYTYRVRHLQQVEAKIRFISLEPLLGPIRRLPLSGIGWVVVGGESGPQSRPMKECWVQDIKKQCQKRGIPFFFKQWGGRRKCKTGRILDGRTWDEFPKHDLLRSAI